MRKLLIFCFALIIALSNALNAQTVTVTSRIDSTSIGLAIRPSFRSKYRSSPTNITMPIFSDTVWVASKLWNL